MPTGLFDMTVAHLLDRIRKYEFVEFMEKMHAEASRRNKF
jgi:hypothetical protein